MSPPPRDTNAGPELATSGPRQLEVQPSQKKPSELRLAISTLLLPLNLNVVLAANYIGAFHALKPHHVKLAIVDAPVSAARRTRSSTLINQGTSSWRPIAAAGLAPYASFTT